MRNKNIYCYFEKILRMIIIIFKKYYYMIIWSAATCIYSKLLRISRINRDMYTGTTLRIIHIEGIDSYA